MLVINIKLLIDWQGFDVLKNEISMVLEFLRSLRPWSVPLDITPRVSNSKQLQGLASNLIFQDRVINNVLNRVSVVENESSGLVIHKKLTLLSVSLDAASKEAAIVVSSQEEVPEALVTAIILLNHLMRE